MFYHVYLIKNKINNQLYIGVTSNLKERLNKHNAGKVQSTRRYGQWVLVYVESYLSEADALKREKNLKYFGKAYTQLKLRIKNSLNNA